MEVSLEQIKKLREVIGAGVVDCKQALSEAGGDMDKAIEILRKKGISQASKKSGRPTREGIIYSYIHPGEKLGVLLEINCETDFVAKNEEFRNLAKEIALQIAAMSASWIAPEDVPAQVLAKEKEVYLEQLKNSNKPEKIIENIIKGKLEKFYEEVCLLEQIYIRDSQLKVKDLINKYISKFGENINIRRFVRFEVGKD